MIERGPLRIEDAVSILLQAIEGVAEAHAHGIVHRDLKPRNMFLTRRVHGQPLLKILDFGLAKTYASYGEDAKLTGTQTVMGSPQYMSPEQMRATRDVDPRTDIWSLGICLYELLVGVPPFDAPTIPLLFVHVMTNDPVPITTYRRDVPEELWNVIAKCLAKDPQGRFANLWELASALEPFAPSARGAADRVLTILQTPPPPPIPDSAPSMPSSHESDTRTAGAFDSYGDKRSTGNVWLVVGAGALAALVLTGAGALVVHQFGSNHASPAKSVLTSSPPSQTVVTQPIPTLDPPAPTAVDTTHPAIVDAGARVKPTTTTTVRAPTPTPTTSTKKDAGTGPSSKF